MPESPNPSRIFDQALADHLALIHALPANKPVLEQIAAAMVRAIRDGRKIMWCGNGGSAADAQHLAAEFVVRFRHDRRSIASIALTTDTSILTAASNDYGYEHIFRRQVEALGVAGDVVVGISTSGNSRNVYLALEAARRRGAVTVAFTGKGGGKLATWADLLFAVPSTDTARIQEAHILAGHILCEIVELEAMQPQTGTEAGTGEPVIHLLQNHPQKV
jgi:D-sedoheptulose 7-phosphate isomerase